MHNKKIEIKGRLYLWHQAIGETKHLLELYERSLISTKREDIIQENEKFEKSVQEFKSSIPDTVDWRVARDLEIDYVRQYERTFPTLAECYVMSKYFLSLAVVYFCQIMVSGNHVAGKASKNYGVFDEQFAPLIDEVFTSKDEKERFFTFCLSLRHTRDKMLAHADASEFDIQHSYKMTTLKLISPGDIDVKYWAFVAQKLSFGIFDYLNKLGG